jgi:hypothetical protein
VIIPGHRLAGTRHAGRCAVTGSDQVAMGSAAFSSSTARSACRSSPRGGSFSRTRATVQGTEEEGRVHARSQESSKWREHVEARIPTDRVEKASLAGPSIGSVRSGLLAVEIGEEFPFALEALEYVRAAVSEGEARVGCQCARRGGSQDLVRRCLV